MKLKISLPPINKVAFLLVLFIYIYAPPLNFIPVGPNKFLIPVALTSLLFFFKSTTLKILKQKHITIAIFFMVISIIYAFIIDTSTVLTSDLPVIQKNTYSQIIILIEVLPIALFLSIYAIRKLKLSLVEILSSLVTIASIQSFLAVIMLLLPKLRLYILTAILGYDPSKDKIFRPDLYSFRSFGISQDYLFSFSIVQGIAIVCILSLCLSDFSKYKYSLLLIPILLLSIALNARIGFVPIVFFVVVTLIFALSRLKIYLLSKFLLFSLISCLTIYISIANVNFFFDLDVGKNLEWAADFFIQGQNFAQGSKTKTGNFGKIQRNFLHLPTTTSARIFGEGRYVFSNSKSSLSSDVGYVRKIYFGGYLYSFLAYSTLIYLFLGSQAKKQKDIFKPFFYCLLLTVLVSQFKGDIFLPIPGFRIIFLLFLFAISERRLSKSTFPINNNRFISWYPHETDNFKS